MIRFFSTPARRARLAVASKSFRTIPAGSGIGPNPPHDCGVPRMWFNTSPALPSMATLAKSGSKVRPLGSLMISTSYSSARAAVSALYVSTDTGIPSFPRSRFRTGANRPHSSSAEMRFDSGRVDSAPRSITSAPNSSNSNARAYAWSGCRNLPPSVKESGVTFSTPMTSVRSPSCNSVVRSFQ